MRSDPERESVRPYPGLSTSADVDVWGRAGAESRMNVPLLEAIATRAAKPKARKGTKRKKRA